MKSKFIYITLLFLFQLSISAQGMNSQTQTMMKILSKKAEIINSYSAKVVTLRTIEEKKIKQEGRIYYLKDKAILYEFPHIYINNKDQGKMIIFSDKKKAINIREKAKKAFVTNLEELYAKFPKLTTDFTDPLVILNMAKPFNFKGLTEKDIKNFEVEFLNNKLTYKFNAVFIDRLSKEKTKMNGRLWVDPNTGLLLKVEGYNKKGTIYTFELKQIKINQPIDPSKLKIKIPPDYEIINVTKEWEKLFKNYFRSKN